jgi:hypothetical protein
VDGIMVCSKIVFYGMAGMFSLLINIRGVSRYLKYGV